MPQSYWYLGLPQAIAQSLEVMLSAPMAAADPSKFGDIREDTAIFVAASTWDSVPRNARRVLEQGGLACVLVADTTAEHALELFAAGRFVAVVTLPLTAEKISTLLEQLREMFRISEDMRNMAKEITLERELLVRKNEELAFLNGVLRNASATLEIHQVLSAYLHAVTTLVPVHQAAAVLWESTGNGLEADFLLPHGIPELQEQWINHLGRVMERLGGGIATAFRREILEWGEPLQHPPHKAELFTQALQTTQGGTFGALVLCTQGVHTLGRDRLRTLHAAANHVALALHNALRFRRVKAMADHDGLTHIANRYAFDKRLREEMKRHQRHAQELSLLMLDLDFFKAVNDTYGHLAGDMVLTRVGQLLQRTLRESDFPARFGGEEFIVLLPQTSEEQAWVLAERLRDLIAQERFSFEGKTFRVTASIGVAGMRPGAFTPPEALVHEADQALYRAKTGGRNMVCVSSLGEASAPICAHS